SRRKVLDAKTSDEKLAVIRELREEEWAAKQPKQVRDELAKLSGEARSKRIPALRQEDRQFRQAGFKSSSAPVPRPPQYDDLPPDVQLFMKDVLTPALPEDEAKALKKAEGKWPDYPRAILDLTDRYLVHRPVKFGMIKDIGKSAPVPTELRKQLSSPV